MRVPTSKIAKSVNSFFDVRKSDIQGRGAFANTTIKKGQRVIEYDGERISEAEADRRYDESVMKRHHTFLFTLTSKTVVDGAVNGNESIYINHSCDPNCEAVISGKRIYIEAIRTIQPGEELAYDYQYERTDESDEEIAKFYACRCGAANCRGSIMKAAAPKRKKKTAAKKKSGVTKGGKKKALSKKKTVKKAGKTASKKGAARKSKGVTKKKSGAAKKRGR